LPQKKYNGDAFFLTNASKSISLNDILGVKTPNDTAANVASETTNWNLPVPVYVSVDEANDMVDWNEQIYYKTTVARYDVRLTRSATHLLQASWWFDSNKAANELNWEIQDLLLLIEKELKKKKEKESMLKDPAGYHDRKKRE
jgi:hypothetical protein